MTVGELLITNKGRYTRAFLLQNDEENKALFTEIKDETIAKDMILVESKDYFLLDTDTVDEIFRKSEELNLLAEDLNLIIAI